MRPNKKGTNDALRYQQALIQLIRQGKEEEAWRKIHARLLFVPNDVFVLHEAARLARRSGQLDDAERYYQRALRLKPQDAGMLNGLGLTHYDAGRYDAAEHCYIAALNAHSGYVACHNNYGVMLNKVMRYEEALVQYQHALRIKPDYSEAAYSMSAVLAYIGRLNEAEAVMRKVLISHPDDGRCRNSLGMVLLQKGQYQEGWELYKSRYAKNNKERFYHLPSKPIPYWQGEDLTGKSILVQTEQGMGDEIQFIRYLPRLKREMGAKHVIMIGRAELRPLMASLEGIDDYLIAGERKGLPACDYHSMLLDLPRHFLRSPTPFSAQIPYLSSNEVHPSRWTLRERKLRVGIVWKGSAGHKNDQLRSLPHLSVLAPLLASEDISWISLQKGAGEDEVTAFPHVLPLGSQFHHYQDTATVIAQLDLVIGVDTSVIHLAGAMGKPCWVMLSSTARDWRWQEGELETPWYPTVRLFARHSGEEWSAVIERLVTALKTYKLSCSSYRY
jgi:tetratricopeptide (TPR) repeat protein